MFVVFGFWFNYDWFGLGLYGLFLLFLVRVARLWFVYDCVFWFILLSFIVVPVCGLFLCLLVCLLF